MNIKNTIAALALSLSTLGISAMEEDRLPDDISSMVKSNAQAIINITKTASYTAGITLIGFTGYHVYQVSGEDATVVWDKKSLTLLGLGVVLVTLPQILDAHIEPAG